MTKNVTEEFNDVLWRHYADLARTMPWRNSGPDGEYSIYKIIVSELMLQQTQVDRVVPKFEAFVSHFPTIESLAKAQFSEVVGLWNGLGYNRRSKYLHFAAQSLSRKPEPYTYEDLLACKGIGHNTAAAILVYSYNMPIVFVETNIRTVYIHHFFGDAESVSDKDIEAILSQSIDLEHPREFYWALMDYGTFLKKQGSRAARRSVSYAKQSTFEGSRRQLRGRVLRQLTEGAMSVEGARLKFSDDRLEGVLQDLEKDSLITQKDGYISL